jgi:hypothetical protein
MPVPAGDFDARKTASHEAAGSSSRGQEIQGHHQGSEPRG